MKAQKSIDPDRIRIADMTPGTFFLSQQGIRHVKIARHHPTGDRIEAVRLDNGSLVEFSPSNHGGPENRRVQIQLEMSIEEFNQLLNELNDNRDDLALRKLEDAIR